MDYTHFSVEDFITDEKFIKWIKNPDTQSKEFWESWVQAHPEKKQEIEEARQIVLMIDFENEEMDEEQLKYIKDQVHRRTGTKDYHQNNKENKGKIVSFLPNKWYWVAASVLTIVMAGIVTLFLVDNEVKRVHATGYGEKKSFYLPDSSKVTLNSNSKLVLGEEWEGQSSRIVSLKGEAFFNIKKLEANKEAKNFIVRSGELGVEVLGTQFNVNNRRNRTQVVLTEGKVAINTQDNNNGIKNVVMNPGELVEYTENNKKIKKELVDPEVYTSWRNDQLIFDETPLKEIAVMIEDNYEYKVNIVDEGLGSRKLTARLPTTDLSVLLKTLEATFKINAVQEKNTIQFKDK